MRSEKVLFGVIEYLFLKTSFTLNKRINTRKAISTKGEDYFNNFKNKFEDFILSVTNELDQEKTISKTVDEIKNMDIEKAKVEIKKNNP